MRHRTIDNGDHVRGQLGEEAPREGMSSADDERRSWAWVWEISTRVDYEPVHTGSIIPFRKFCEIQGSS
jgi:hypothetical protein